MKCDHATVKLDSPSSHGDEKKKNELNDILEKSAGYQSYGLFRLQYNLFELT